MAETSKPIRVQLSRAKGWKMPENTVKVSRPGKWGNPFRVGGYFIVGDPGGAVHRAFRMAWCESDRPDPKFTLITDSAMAVAFFTRLMANGYHRDLSALRGKNLACWCRIGTPCHADILLELANPPEHQGT